MLWGEPSGCEPRTRLGVFRPVTSFPVYGLRECCERDWPNYGLNKENKAFRSWYFDGNSIHILRMKNRRQKEVCVVHLNRSKGNISPLAANSDDNQRRAMTPRATTPLHPRCQHRPGSVWGSQGEGLVLETSTNVRGRIETVSYTHLTLPTILRV